MTNSLFYLMSIIQFIQTNFRFNVYAFAQSALMYSIAQTRFKKVIEFSKSTRKIQNRAVTSSSPKIIHSDTCNAIKIGFTTNFNRMTATEIA